MSDWKDMYDFSILRELRKKAALTIADVSERSGVSQAVISKLERNQNIAELETVYKLGRVFEMNPSDLLSLAESRSAHRITSTHHEHSGFHFEEIRYGNVRCLMGKAPKGARVSRDEIHKDDYEVCWVTKGRLAFYLSHEKYHLEAGEAIQFDALLAHTYEVLEDCEILVVHIQKEKRF
jgi:transcriptional regulator with XRE-family HTH domain